MTVLAISFAACSNGGKLTPVSKKINGPLGKFFEVVERDYKINDNELSVEFKRIAEGGPSSASWSSEPTFLVELQDEDGNTITSEHTNVVFNKEQLESIFALSIDETTSITFRFDKKKTKKSVKFKVSSKWEETNEDNEDIDQQEQLSLNLKGILGGSDDAIFTYNDKTDEGEVVFTVNGVKNMRKLKMGAYDKNTNNLVMKEYFTNGNYVGNFDGIWKNGVYQGVFTNTKGGRVDFILKSTATGDVANDLLNDNEYSLEDNNLTNEEGDSSYDEFLDEYEKYWRTYMSFIKKMDKDNPTAMIEYAKLLKQYQSLSEKLERIKGNLSTTQLNRINKMNAELIEQMNRLQ